MKMLLSSQSLLEGKKEKKKRLKIHIYPILSYSFKDLLSMM